MIKRKIKTIGILALLAVVVLSSGFIINDGNFSTKNNDPIPNKKVKSVTPKYVDAAVYLSNLGVVTKVDEQVLREKYGQVTISSDKISKTVLFNFPVVNKSLASLQVFDSAGNIIYSITNLDTDNIKLQLKQFADSEYYLYKYASNNNTYCGKFSLQ